MRLVAVKNITSEGCTFEFQYPVKNKRGFPSKEWFFSWEALASEMLGQEVYAEKNIQVPLGSTEDEK